MQSSDDEVQPLAVPAVRVLSSAEEVRVSDRVYRELLGRLVTRDIAPDSRISIDGMSRELGVSQTPVREALAQLEVEGLVTRIHLSGFRSQPLLTVEQFKHLFEMRLLIEPYVSGQAAVRHTEDQAEAMDAAAERMRGLAAKIELPTYGEFASEDAWLHDLIASAAENPLLRESLIRLHSHVHLFRLHYDVSVSLDAIGEHDDLLAAIADRRPKAAAAAMREHLLASQQRLQVAFQ